MRNIVECFILYLFVDLSCKFCCSGFSVTCDKSVWHNTFRYPQFSRRYCSSGFEPDDASSLKFVPPRQSNQVLRRDYILQILYAYTFSSIHSIGEPSFSTESSITSAFASTSQWKSDNSVYYPSDLPDVSPNCFRLYLVRHGETENNRLHLVQGARVDSSLNDTGEKQAQRLGRALSVLQGNKNYDDLLFVHSNLKRSKETAQIAASTYLKCKKTDSTHSNNGGDYEQKEVSTPLTDDTPIPDLTSIHDDPSFTLELLSSIGEIDFGLQEGKPSSSVRSDMFQTYSSWSVGFIDVRSADGSGETGREVRIVCWVASIIRKVLLHFPLMTASFFINCACSLCFLILNKVLNRIEHSFHSFVKISRTNSSKPRRDIVAVSHGQFIRMMLAVALDMPLFQVFTTVQQKNACINILDISFTEKVTRRAKNCNLFGGPFLSQITDDNLTIVLPKITAVCIGETRHLHGLE